MIEKEILEFLKESDLTVQEMDSFWSECVEVNSKCRKLAESGKNWTDFPISTIRKTPTLKEETLRKQKVARAEKEKKVSGFLKENQCTTQDILDACEYYNNHFDEFMLQKIEKGEELTEEELNKLVNNKEVEREVGDNGRWSRPIISIISLCGRYFRICWSEGLTEYQEDFYYEQPVEVKKHTYEKTITVTVTEWNEIGGNKNE